MGPELSLLPVYGLRLVLCYQSALRHSAGVLFCWSSPVCSAWKGSSQLIKTLGEAVASSDPSNGPFHPILAAIITLCGVILLLGTAVRIRQDLIIGKAVLTMAVASTPKKLYRSIGGVCFYGCSPVKPRIDQPYVAQTEWPKHFLLQR
jgi:hypothetical protein